MKSDLARNLFFLAILLVNIYAISALYSKKNRPTIEKIVPVQDYAIRDLIIQLLESQNIEIIDSLKFSTKTNSIFSISDLSEGKNTWFMYLPAKSCHNCLSDFLSDIEFYWGNEILNNINFYTSFNDSLSIVRIENDFKIRVLNIDNNYLGFPHERRQEYFIFCLNETGRIKHFFPLSQGWTQWNKLFFKVIRSRTT
ncbi:MAG: hypothetical protein M0Q41_12095 [Bacteroidales bacterium]|nr:hypothetical protein [Bacteroidales bacterium]